MYNFDFEKANIMVFLKKVNSGFYYTPELLNQTIQSPETPLRAFYVKVTLVPSEQQ